MGNVPPWASPPSSRSLSPSQYIRHAHPFHFHYLNLLRSFSRLPRSSPRKFLAHKRANFLKRLVRDTTWGVGSQLRPRTGQNRSLQSRYPCRIALTLKSILTLKRKKRRKGLFTHKTWWWNHLLKLQRLTCSRLKWTAKFLFMNAKSHHLSNLRLNRARCSKRRPPWSKSNHNYNQSRLYLFLTSLMK